MATMTLEVPDQLADQLYLEQERLPELLEEALRQRQEPPPLSIPSSLAFGEMIEFLASRPSFHAIQSFKISQYAQERLAALLEKNREVGLSDAESAELDWYEYVHEIMTRLKAETRLHEAP